MSKSLGTGIDPLELIEKYGADATRLGLMYQMSSSQQAIRFDERDLIAARNFINKLWNISRFVTLTSNQPTTNSQQLATIKPATLADQWIFSRLNNLIISTTKKIENYELGEAAKELYEFGWHELADWYLEASKFQTTNDQLKNNTDQCLKFILDNLLKLLHPFIPFVTEQIWQSTRPDRLDKNNNLLIVAS